MLATAASTQVDGLEGEQIRLSIPSTTGKLEWGTLAKWCKQVGESVSPEDTIIQVRLPGGVLDLKAPVWGVLARKILSTGDRTCSGQPFGILKPISRQRQPIASGMEKVAGGMASVTKRLKIARAPSSLNIPKANITGGKVIGLIVALIIAAS